MVYLQGFCVYNVCVMVVALMPISWYSIYISIDRSISGHLLASSIAMVCRYIQCRLGTT